MRDDFERSTLRLINAIVTLTNSSQHAQQFAAATGLQLRSADVRLVEFLSGQPPVPISQIAEALAIDLAQASRQVSRLVADGHVVRQTDPTDGRRMLATLHPTAAGRLDDWLLLWSAAHRAPLAGWSADDLAELAACLNTQVTALHISLPLQPVLLIDARWDELVEPGLSSAARAAGRAIVALVTWIGQSQGFDDLLDYLDSPVRQANFLVLRTVISHGPLAISEVAELMSIDPSLASKRLGLLTELNLVDRTTADTDRRRTLVRASAAGVAFEHHVLDTQLRTFRSTLPVIEPARRRRWADLMERYISGLDFLAER